MPAETINAYIAAQPEPVRRILAELRRTIHTAVPGVTEEIKYRMPAFRLAGTYLLYVAAWKKHIGMYPVSFGTDFEPEIAPYRAEKDTVQFKYAEPVPYELVARIARARAAALAARG
jgi:uncharacterized protein YdhG (YjbR/CyaY superfamily)